MKCKLIICLNTRIAAGSSVKTSLIFPRCRWKKCSARIRNCGQGRWDLLRNWSFGTAEHPVVLKKGQKVTEDIVSLKILFVAAEGAQQDGWFWGRYRRPPKSLVAGHEVGVILRTMTWRMLNLVIKLKTSSPFEVSVSWRQEYVGVKKIEWKGVNFFIDNQHHFFRGHVCKRFWWRRTLFSLQLAAIELMEPRWLYPRCSPHDYHAAMIPFLVRKIPLDSRHITASSRQCWPLQLRISGGSFRTACSGNSLVLAMNVMDGTLRWNDASTGWEQVFFMRIAWRYFPSYANEFRRLSLVAVWIKFFGWVRQAQCYCQ